MNLLTKEEIDFFCIFEACSPDNHFPVWVFGVFHSSNSPLSQTFVNPCLMSHEHVLP
jgi:hypothetical protein